MAVAEQTPTAANDAERKGVAPPSATPAPTPAPSPAPAALLSPDPDAAAKALYYKTVGIGDKTPFWVDLNEKTKNFWRGRAKQGYDPSKQSKLKNGTVVDVPPKDDSGSQSDPPAPAPAPGSYVPEPQHEVPQKVDDLLVNILSWPRKHESVSELAFCQWLREYITGIGQAPLVMAEGCTVVTIKPPLKSMGDGSMTSTASTVLFSCHVDTVEGSDTLNVTMGEGDKPVIPRKKLNYDPNFGLIALEKDSIGGSLGADDGAGVWLMLKMIERKVPGTYIFHRGEEVGGRGSSAMAQKYEELLKAYECAVAFDRHDTFEVIYQQGGSTCASQKFTQAVCDRLNKHGMNYQPSSRGVFTDTKNYRKIIPECINIAVGYQSQHGRNESLDYAHLAALLEAVCAIDWDALPVDRDPTVPEYYGGYQGGGYGRYSGGSYGRGRGGDTLFDDEDDHVFTFPQGGKGGTKKSKKKAKQAAARKDGPTTTLTVSQELETCSLEDLETWCIDEPENAAAAIGQLLVEIKQLQATSEMLMKLMGWEDK